MVRVECKGMKHWRGESMILYVIQRIAVPFKNCMFHKWLRNCMTTAAVHCNVPMHDLPVKIRIHFVSERFGRHCSKS